MYQRTHYYDDVHSLVSDLLCTKHRNKFRADERKRARALAHSGDLNHNNNIIILS